MAGNVSPWRRAVCGNLTSAFDFRDPDARVPNLPDTSGYAPPDRTTHPSYVPLPPASQAVPKQESGLRPARALPYELFAYDRVDASTGKFKLTFANTGSAGAAFQVQAANRIDGPWAYTVEARRRLSDSWSTVATLGLYDLSVYGPNCFLCQFRGSTSAGDGRTPNPEALNPEALYGYDVINGNLTLRLSNRGRTPPVRLTVSNAYSGATRSVELFPGQRLDEYVDLRGSHGWYDLTVSDGTTAGFLRRFAGHVETGRASTSDPAIATL
ncbi:MAG: Non-hemolytic phospholipase C [Burkholderia gladioli]|nr:MAG: Non-hemolytic phospholipase C [Burkholderia gladioli]